MQAFDHICVCMQSILQLQCSKCLTVSAAISSVHLEAEARMQLPVQAAESSIELSTAAGAAPFGSLHRHHHLHVCEMAGQMNAANTAHIYI
jgi:hypothetical protein